MDFSTLTTLIRNVPDFPKPGIQFKDITPLLQDAKAFSTLIDKMAADAEGLFFHKIAAIESRGFILGAALAKHMGVGLTLIRKPGKLPWKTQSEAYDLEYGMDQLQIHEDALKPKEKVLVVDDVLATGGTASAALKLCRKLNATPVGLLVFIELGFLNGRQRIEQTLDIPVRSSLRY